MSNSKGKCCTPVVNQFFSCGCCCGSNGGNEETDDNGSSTGGIGSWKLLKKVTGGTPITLPTDFEELNIQVKFKYSAAGPISNYVNIPFHILRTNLTVEKEHYELGAYHLPTSNEIVSLMINKTTVFLHCVAFNSIDKFDDAEVIVYYR